MKKLTRVSSKLLILSIIPLIVFSLIIFTSIDVTNNRYQHSLQTLETRLSQTQKLNLIIRTFTSNIIDTAHKTRSGMLLWQDAQKQVNAGAKIINQQWHAYLNEPLSKQEEKLAQSMLPLYKNSTNAIKKITDYIAQESSYSMGNYIDLHMYSVLEPFLIKLDELVLLQKLIIYTLGVV